MLTLLAQVTDTVNHAATAVAGKEEASEHLLNRLTTRMDDFIGVIGTVNFYAELSMISIALVMAWVLNTFFQQKIAQRIASTSPRFLDAELLAKPLTLLESVLVLMLLWATQLMAIYMEIGGDLTDDVFELAYAYFLVKCVALVVKTRIVASILSLMIVANAVLRALRISHSTQAYLDSVAFEVGKYHLSVLQSLHGFIIFVVVFWGAGVLSNTLETYLRRTTSLSITARELTAKFFRIFVYLTAFVITLSSMGIDLTAFAVFGGALGVGVGLGLQKLTSNFLSGITMLMEKSIKIGDLIEVAGNTGWVRQLNIRYALVETFDGREIMIPNEELISTRVINWTLSHSLARVDINVVVAPDSDAEKTKSLMLEAATAHPLCMKTQVPNCWLREITGHGLHFMLVFWIADIKEGRSGPQSDVLFSLLGKFKEHGITLAKLPMQTISLS